MPTLPPGAGGSPQQTSRARTPRDVFVPAPREQSMALHRSVTPWLAGAMLVGLLTAAGCQPTPKPGPPPPPPPRSLADAERIQADLLPRDRSARAGLVVRVHPQDQNV